MREIFKDIGMSSVESKVLEYLFLHNEGESRIIERNMELRQPEVSIVLSLFVEKGWVSRKKLPHTGKGRPSILFSLKKTREEILDELIKACNEEIGELMELNKKLVEFKEENYADKKKKKK